MYQLRVSNIIPQPNENLTLEFEPVDGYFPPYKAGQFMTLSFKFGEREVRRSYSFNSSPDHEEPLSITVKRVENGEISRLIHDKIKIGDIITVMDPQGQFTYTPEKEKLRTVFLFAAGIGITPLLSILKTALLKENKSKIVLAYSNGSRDRTAFVSELERWHNDYPDRLWIEWIFSSSKNLLTARLNRNYIHRLLAEHLVGKKEDALFYTCGPWIYMDLCRFTLLGMGFEEKQVRRETFQLPEEEQDEDDNTVKKIDTNTYAVRIHFKNKTYDLNIPYDKSILDVGLEHKIDLPYSCRSGMCSTCASQCIKGHVRMEYNEVLTDREMDNGRILLCTGHPTENGTEIEIG